MITDTMLLNKEYYSSKGINFSIHFFNKVMIVDFLFSVVARLTKISSGFWSVTQQIQGGRDYMGQCW